MHPHDTLDRPDGRHPYDRLTPDAVLDALDAVGLRGDGRLLTLNSYENRVYQVFLDPPAIDADGQALPAVVAKFYRPGRWTDAQILEEHAFAQELAAAEIPVVAPLPLATDPPGTLGHHGGFAFATSPRRGGRAPELDQPEVLGWLGRFIGRIHAVGAVTPFRHRIALTPDSHGIQPRDWLLAQEQVPPDVSGAWRRAVDAALDEVRRCHDRAGDVPLRRVHGDCHLGNVLWTDAGPHFVDLDDACMAPAAQDLWMLLSGDRPSRTLQLSEVLEGYEAFCDFDRRELNLLEALRTLRLVHHSAWLARRWDDPAFPAAFPWFGTSAYWSQQVQLLQDQCELMREPPLVV